MTIHPLLDIFKVFIQHPCNILHAHALCFHIYNAFIKLSSGIHLLTARTRNNPYIHLSPTHFFSILSITCKSFLWRINTLVHYIYYHSFVIHFNNRKGVCQSCLELLLFYWKLFWTFWNMACCTQFLYVLFCRSVSM